MYKFQAAVLENLNAPLNIYELQIKSLELGQVIVKIFVSGICGAQLQEISGAKGNAGFLPHLLGHEGCGIVVETGPGVTKVKPGDKVVMHWKKGNGIESQFPSYWCGNQKISGGKVTTLSEYSVVSENRLTVVDSNVSNDFCALLGCGLSTALGTINYEAKLKFGESILILGCGGLGLNLITSARLAGAYPIVVYDLNDKSKLSNTLGCNLFTTDFHVIKNHKYDVVIDTTGNSDLIKKTIPLIEDDGRYIFIGQNKPGKSLELENSNQLFGLLGKSFKFSQGGDINPDRDIKRYSNLSFSNLIDTDKIITHRFTLNNINEAFEVLKTGFAGRIMVDM